MFHKKMTTIITRIAYLRLENKLQAYLTSTSSHLFVSSSRDGGISPSKRMFREVRTHNKKNKETIVIFLFNSNSFITSQRFPQ